MSQTTPTKRLALATIVSGTLAAGLTAVGIWLLIDSQTLDSSTSPETLKFRNLSTTFRPHHRIILTIDRITIFDDTSKNAAELHPSLRFTVNFSRISKSGNVETSSRTIPAEGMQDSVLQVKQNLPIASIDNLEERPLFYSVGSGDALTTDVYAVSERWGSDTRCPPEEGSQHYFDANNRFGLGAHTLSQRCDHDGLDVEYRVDYTIREWNPQLTIREVWLGSSHNSGICYQAANQGSTASWYYRVEVHLSSASGAQPIVSSPPLFPLAAGQEVAGCLGLPRLQQHALDSLRVELKQLYNNDADRGG